jgi:Mycobacterium membrane protein
MSDPRRPDGPDPNGPQWSQPTQQLGFTDPAYSGQYTYPSYLPSTPNPTEQLPPYWTQTNQYPPQYPPPGGQPGEPPPNPPKSPRWLWIVAALAVLLVVGLVIALVIANSSSKEDTVVAPLPPMPESGTTSTPSTTAPAPRTTATAAPPTMTVVPPTAATPSTTAPGVTETVVYSVDGPGRAISITYVDAGGVLQMEFNVALPWSRQVSLSSPSSNAASVTVLNVGQQISCSVSVNGTTVRQRSGTGLTICASAG